MSDVLIIIIPLQCGTILFCLSISDFQYGGLIQSKIFLHTFAIIPQHFYIFWYIWVCSKQALELVLGFSELTFLDCFIIDESWIMKFHQLQFFGNMFPLLPQTKYVKVRTFEYCFHGTFDKFREKSFLSSEKQIEEASFLNWPVVTPPIFCILQISVSSKVRNNFPTCFNEQTGKNHRPGMNVK